VRDLPRQLTADQLAELFERRTRFVELLAERDDPLGPVAEQVAAELSEAEKLEALNAHPAIGARNLSPRSAAEQGAEADAATLTELAYLNQVYEEKFGFRFVVFVDRRPKAELVPVMHERLERTREEELETAMSELVAIARDRWSAAAD
jgi:2-oxo-4-hydroxy-4-carboxy--5-ureidoimidazoline (OHCU) decarboxylase